MKFIISEEELAYFRCKECGEIIAKGKCGHHRVRKGHKYFERNIPRRLYHGTCLAFVIYAMNNGGKFGPSCSKMSFTPSLEHARMFAENWKQPYGIERLKQYFGENINEKLAESAILQFDGKYLGELNYKDDCGVAEFYINKGPIDLVEENILSA